MRVIATYGMDEENLVCLSPEQILNTTLAKEFIERTNRLLKEQMKETENLICSGREKVEALAKKLLEQNHLTQNEICLLYTSDAADEEDSGEDRS